MFFQVNISPQEKKTTQVKKDQSPKNVYTLLLAPFQPPTHVKMETKQGLSIQSTVTIRNASNRSLTVSVTKIPPQERCLNLSSNEWHIQPEASATLELTWEPKESGVWRDTIQLTDNRKIKHDIFLILHCVAPKPQINKKGNRRLVKPVPKSSNGQDSVKNSENIKNKIITSKVVNQQAAVKRTRPVLHEILDKENVSENISHNWMIEQARVKKQRKDEESSHEFSRILNSKSFQLTPLHRNTQSRETEISENPKINIDKSYEEWSVKESFTIQQKVEVNLRKETYVTVPKFLNVEDNCKVNDTDKNEFDDSLSPKEEIEFRKPSSNFSMILNDLQFTPIRTTNTFCKRTQNATKFSPNVFSTNKKSNVLPIVSSDKPDDSVFANSINEFDYCNNENPKLNDTYELPSTSSPNSEDKVFIKPKNLSTLFTENDINIEFSTPCHESIVPVDSNTYKVDRIRSEKKFSKGQSDNGSAKNCLEADMWIKSKKRSMSPLSKLNFSLESIKEEQQKLINVDELDEYNKEIHENGNEVSKGICLEISPPKKFPSSRLMAKKSDLLSPKYKNGKVNKEKTSKETAMLKKKVQIKDTVQDIVNTDNIKISKLSLAKLQKLPKRSKEVSIKFHDPDNIIYMICNPDPFAATTTHDPFLSTSMYYGDQWMHNQEIKFSKWLNALLTPPEHLNTNIESSTVDIAKIWKSCVKNEDITLAETKESVSSRYHTETRLNTLRKAAVALYHKPEVVKTLSKTTSGIEREILLVRQDCDLHRDIGLQKIILELFLSYNPLWLRIGLETVYGETIPLRSNDDLAGLSRFLLTRFFADPYLVKTYSHASHPNIRLPTFQFHMNKFILKKFLFLVYFLDQAKNNKLIGHDPCLFRKKTVVKESRTILLTFSREVLSGIGDITKVLRNYGYVVTHKQTYIDEYDYAVANLSTDLRDGVRLCRVMEVIASKQCLTCRCRVPAISRLQKVFNVNIALTVLQEVGYRITGNIDARSIADGHREKTLSLLWQIIYKVQAPRFEKAAKTVQRWWRSKMWYVSVRKFLKNRKTNAACTIQRAWRCYLARNELNKLKEKYLEELRIKMQAVKKIESYWIGKKETRYRIQVFQITKLSVIKIQRWWRRIQITKKDVQEFKRKKDIIINLQRRWRAKKLMNVEKLKFKTTKEAALKIQKKWRANKIARETLRDFQKLQQTVRFIKNKWRAKKEMEKQRELYLKKLEAVKFIQNWWRRYLVLKIQRSNYLLLKNAVLVIEKAWITKNFIPEERKKFLLEKNSAIIIQKCWRRHKETKKYRVQLKNEKNAIITIQSWYRMNKVKRTYRKQYQSCVVIQNWWRSSILTKSQRSNFLDLKHSSIIIQKNWKMIIARKKYLITKSAILKIQMWYKNLMLSRKIRCDYLQKKNAANILKIRWMSRKLAKAERLQYLKLKKSSIIIQQKWRANIKMKQKRKEYLNRKNASIKIQSWWRMIMQKQKYHDLLSRVAASTVIQQWWRAQKIGVQAREEFLKQKKAACLIQARWRATKLGRAEKHIFETKRKACIIIQSKWKSYKLSKVYNKKKAAINYIKNWIKHKQNGKKIRQDFLELKGHTIKMQRLWQSNHLAKKYRQQKVAAIRIQKYWRSYIEMKNCRNRFQNLKSAAIILQRRYRSKLISDSVRKEYLHTINSVKIIQKWWIKILYGRNLKEYQNNRKMSIIIIEKWWLSLCKVREQRKKENLAVTKIQALWRGYQIRKKQCKKMAELRERSKKAAEAAIPTQTLAFRLQESIEFFIHATSIGQLSVCLSSLDVITRLSPNACINVCEMHLVDRLYEILAKANRSLPWFDVCLKDISILLTLAKFEPSKPYVLKEEHLETIVHILKVSLENKKTELFLNTATLFWVLIEDRQYAEVTKSHREAKYLLTSLTTIANKSKSNKCNLNNSMANRSILNQSTKQKFDELPSPKPDWGLRNKRPRTFNDVFQAINSILFRLNMMPVKNNMSRSLSFTT